VGGASRHIDASFRRSSYALERGGEPSRQTTTKINTMTMSAAATATATALYAIRTHPPAMMGHDITSLDEDRAYQRLNRGKCSMSTYYQFNDD